jgi:hypothetical protein
MSTPNPGVPARVETAFSRTEYLQSKDKTILTTYLEELMPRHAAPECATYYKLDRSHSEIAGVWNHLATGKKMVLRDHRGHLYS